MTKRLVDIDDEVLDEARRILGTTTLKETVNTALVESVRSGRRRSVTASDLARVGEMLAGLGDPDVMARAWQ